MLMCCFKCWAHMPSAKFYLTLFASGVLTMFCGGPHNVAIFAWVQPVLLLRAFYLMPCMGWALLALIIQSFAMTFAFAGMLANPLLTAKGVFTVLGVSAVYNAFLLIPFIIEKALVHRHPGLRDGFRVMALPSMYTATFFLITLLSPLGTWGHIAYSQWDIAPLVTLASLASIHGIVFLIYYAASVANLVLDKSAVSRARRRNSGSAAERADNSRATNNNAGLDPDSMCTICEIRPLQMHCEDCRLSYCITCGGQLHQVGLASNHRRFAFAGNGGSVVEPPPSLIPGGPSSPSSSSPLSSASAAVASSSSSHSPSRSRSNVRLSGSLRPQVVVCLIILIAFFAVGSLRRAAFAGTFYQKPLPVPASTVPAACIIGQLSTVADLMNRTRAAASRGAKLVIWSEKAAAYDSTLFDQAQQAATQLQIYLGVSYLQTLNQPMPNELDMFQLYSPNGGDPVTYQIAHPVRLGMEESQLAGDEALRTIQTPFGVLGFAIAFDMDFPRYLRQASTQKVDILVQTAWTWGPLGQVHAEMSKYRAVENGMMMFRCSSGGVSGLFGPYAEDYAYTASPLGFDVSIPITPRVWTFYSVFGDTFPWWCVCTSGLILIVAILPQKYIIRMDNFLPARLRLVGLDSRLLPIHINNNNPSKNR